MFHMKRLCRVIAAAGAAIVLSAPFGGVAIGASHDLSPRLRIFGEAGFTYSRGDVDRVPLNDITQTSFGLRSGVGAVILF